MKFKPLILMTCISIFSSASVLALGPSDNVNTPTSTSNLQQNSMAKPNQADMNKDSEIIATLIILNKNEIAAANLAAKKKLTPALKNYVNHLRKDHAKSLDSIMILSKRIKVAPSETAEVNALKQQGQQEITTLQPLSDQQFEKTFTENTIKDHQAVLDKIDNALKNVSNPQLKKYLETMREKITKHLQAAQQLQSKLQPAATGTSQNVNIPSSTPKS